MSSNPASNPTTVSRREFAKTTAAAVAALSLPGWPAFAQSVAPLRVGVIGCGGRGTGAIGDVLRASPEVEVVALADLFPERIAKCRADIAKQATEQQSFAPLAPRFKVTDELTFSGFDAYAKLIATDVDIVFITTPPAFRPLYVPAAIDAGKHVFMEKPVAVDPVGVKAIIAAADRAAARNLGLLTGTQRRHQPEYLETIGRIKDGAIGEIVGGQIYWNQGGLWMHKRQPEWSDVEWQIRNWLYFTWLSGDHIVEQHMHNIDVANWVLGAHPIRASGVGGRQSRTDPAYGHIFDHFAIDFEYANGARIHSVCRQVDGAQNFVGERFAGTQGASDARSWIRGTNAWERPRVPRESRPPSPYVQEHIDFIASIRAGKPLNEGRQVAESTLTAIMGREAAYTGRDVTWDEINAAELDLVPRTIAFGPMATPPVAIPGVTKLARSV
jgi:predicted dehydrogenase